MGITHLLIVDPQYDFCSVNGSLSVKGADKDMERLSTMIYKLGNTISRITVTMDMHNMYHIASPIFWQNQEGKEPDIYTIITSDDVRNGIWQATNPDYRDWALHYVKTLEKNGRYQLCIWPYHCIIGTEGASIDVSLQKALYDYQKKCYNRVDYIFKGSSPYTEHYSALFPDVVVPFDNRTLPNAGMLVPLTEADTILIAGEALSHCVANTVMDIGNHLDGSLSKFILLEDTSSNVTNFEKIGDEFVTRAMSLGMKVSDTTKIEGLL